MGVDIHLAIVKFDRDLNAYKEIKLYKKDDKNNYAPIDLYPARNSELFDYLAGKEDDFPVKHLYEKNLPQDLKNQIDKYKNEEYGCYDFSEANLADVKLYLKDNPKVRDYNYEGGEEEADFLIKGYKENPVLDLVRIVEYALAFDDFFWSYEGSFADVRIIYFFDR